MSQKAIFKVAPKEDYARKIKAFIPGDFNKHEVVEFTIRFKRLSHSELRELAAALSKAAAAARSAVADGDDTFTEDDSDGRILRDNITGWTGLLGPDDQPVAFSPESLDALLEITAYRRSIMKAFLEDLADPEAKNRKN